MMGTMESDGKSQQCMRGENERGPEQTTINTLNNIRTVLRSVEQVLYTGGLPIQN